MVFPASEPRAGPLDFQKAPFTVISTLELLATVVGVMLLVPEGLAEKWRYGAAAISAGTDNQGNSDLASKLITTKFPLCLALLELTTQLQARGLELTLNWRVREENQEADELTNEEFAKFDPSLRAATSWEELAFKVLPELVAQAEDFQGEVEARREARKGVPAATPEKRARKRLRGREPW